MLLFQNFNESIEMFESVVADAFQSIFYLEIYQNNIFFIFLKLFLISIY
jgi:hypothetical protein